MKISDIGSKILCSVKFRQVFYKNLEPLQADINNLDQNLPNLWIEPIVEALRYFR